MSETTTPPKKTAKRVKVAMVISIITLIAIFVGSWLWAAFVVIFLVMGLRELTAMMAALNTRPSQLIVLLMGGLMILTATCHYPQFLSPLLTITVIASFFRLLFRNPVGSMSDIGGTLLAVVYLAYLPVHFILIRELPLAPPQEPWSLFGAVPATVAFFRSQPGLGYLLMTILVVSTSDIAAYYTGIRFGKSLLYPEVSPKKTREGALGGIVAGFLAGVFFCWFSGFPLQHGMFLSLLLTVVGQIGDLIESVFKRNAGMKDSGGMLQGHGGLLDRMDSYIFSGPIAYYYIYWVVLDQGLAHDIRALFYGWSG